MKRTSVSVESASDASGDLSAEAHSAERMPATPDTPVSPTAMAATPSQCGEKAEDGLQQFSFSEADVKVMFAGDANVGVQGPLTASRDRDSAEMWRYFDRVKDRNREASTDAFFARPTEILATGRTSYDVLLEFIDRERPSMPAMTPAETATVLTFLRRVRALQVWEARLHRHDFRDVLTENQFKLLEARALEAVRLKQ